MMTISPDRAIETVGQVASHNTYTTSNWLSHLDQVNTVELDVYPQYNWQVSHTSGAPGGHLYINDKEGYLPDLISWREKWATDHPTTKHNLITVNLEMKSSYGWRVDDFESILKHVDRASRFEPGDLMSWGRFNRYPGTSLKELVKQFGWPTFGSDVVKGKIMFVLNGDDVLDTYLNERPLIRDGHWNTGGDSPICFVMPNHTDVRAQRSDIVISNGEYDDWPLESGMPADRCLRRAWHVNTGNKEMNDGDLTVATANMVRKKINYLAYDDTKNAFSVDF